jgi:hypothetical protein
LGFPLKEVQVQDQELLQALEQAQERLRELAQEQAQVLGLVQALVRQVLPPEPEWVRSGMVWGQALVREQQALREREQE